MRIMWIMWPPAFGLARDAHEALFVVALRIKNENEKCVRPWGPPRYIICCLY